MLRLATLGHIGRHRQCREMITECHRAPDNFHVQKRAVLAPVTPDDAAFRGRGRDLFMLVVFFRRPDVREDHPKKLLARITVLPDGRFVDFQKPEGFQIEHPHRIRIAMEQQAVLFFAFRLNPLRPAGGQRHPGNAPPARRCPDHQSGSGNGLRDDTSRHLYAGNGY